MKTLIAQLDAALYKRIIDEWEKDHFGLMPKENIERKMESAYKNIVHHLVDLLLSTSCNYLQLLN